MLAYYFACLVSRIACLLPRSVAEHVGLALGNLAWLVIPGWRRKMAVENIVLCLGTDPSAAERIARASVVRFGPMLMEVLRFPVLKKHMKEYVTIEGDEYLQDAMEQGGGKGGIIATAHSGNWELMGGALAEAGFPIVGVAMKQKSEGSDRFINEQRTLVGMHITYKTDVREMYDMLMKGWFIGLIMDQDTNRHDGIVLEFFHRPTNCVPGAASMARFKDVPIIPGFMHRREDGTHKLILQPPIRVERTGDKREDIRRTTQEIVRIIEEHIRKYPEEWFWLHDRWKSMRDDD